MTLIIILIISYYLNYDNSVALYVSESGTEGRSRLTSTASDLDAADTSHVLLARLTAAERRVAHLSSLLGESETENARLVQLAEVILIPHQLLNNSLPNMI